ncbi:DNA polymerase lambda isoform X2 [Pristis pectinata]|uniref:DNA polymerase lambda isoform X2 n=1 Tax=Pristis pectinata TaxID=685728 RepID=UPI00223D63FF|nr:DNA polymerase lambda isoform X2 [Pristis pectinata]
MSRLGGVFDYAGCFTKTTRELWLNGMTAYIIQAGIGKTRTEIFQKQIAQNGGEVSLAFSSAVTHVIAEDGMDYDRALHLLKLSVLPPNVQVLRSAWLSSCISERRLLSTTGYSIFTPDNPLPPEQQVHAQKSGDEDQQGNTHPDVNTQSVLSPDARLNCTRAEEPLAEHPQGTTARENKETPQGSAAQFFNADSNSDSEDDGVSQHDLQALISGDRRPAAGPELREPAVSTKWVCARSSESKRLNHNKAITDKLKTLETAYTHQGDKWRALGYGKAINALKSYHKPIASYQEACEIPGIGKRMAEKIWEILETGHLRKLDYISESISVLEAFANIWGAGVKTAQMWYQQGFRTLEDIKTKANPNRQQIIGLKHYHDFLDRMPREEAAEIERTVCDMAHSINPGLISLACGSFRRGKPTCGDVDVLITHPDGKSHRGVFSKVLDGLRGRGFVTDDLVSQEENRNQVKYLGVCRLPGPGHRYRRLDIIVVPYAEFACTLMYFTGSAHFNRSMRALAKTKNMSLSEHSLNCQVLREGWNKVNRGLVLPTPSERAIFEHLGLVYREPQERDW